jgi:hypothetical protein
MKIIAYNPQKSKHISIESSNDQFGGKSSGSDSTKHDTSSSEGGSLPAFSPSTIFYESAASKYYIDVGTHFRVYSQKAPVVRGVASLLMAEDVPKTKDERDDLLARAAGMVGDIEIEQAVDWAGGIAGHKKGLTHFNNFTALITDEPKLILPLSGSFPVIEEILRQGLGEGIQMTTWLGWLSIALKAVIAGKHQPGQLVALAGKKNTGKSLLCQVAARILGGRVGDPYAAWTNSIVWNDDLIRAELLVIDDSVSSTDPRARRALAARFKEAIYSGQVQLRKRHSSSLCVRPVWRVIICCNDNPEALQIIPPIDEDLSDKITLLRVNKITPPVDTSSPEGRDRFWELIEAELPAFVAHLLEFKIPSDLKDTRAGILAYRDVELEKAVLELAPEKRLEEMLIRMFETGHFNLSPGESGKFTASDLQSRMTDSESSVCTQARNLFNSWPAACGVYLGKLSRHRPDMVEQCGKSQNIQKWKITRPAEKG